MTDSPKTERKLTPLNPSQFKEAEFSVQRISAIAPVNATPDDVLQPEFWVHVAHMVRTRGAHIEVWADDDSWWCELLVLRVGVKGLTVRPIHAEDLNVSAAASKSARKAAEEVKVPTGLSVRHVPGGDQKWRVERESDGHVLSHGHQNKLAAIKWAQDYDSRDADAKQPEPEAA